MPMRDKVEIYSSDLLQTSTARLNGKTENEDLEYMKPELKIWNLV